MIIRENYLAKIRPFCESDLVKVITGIRRCGKSVILNQIMDEISKTTDNIIYLNFEKTSDYLKVNNYEGLIKYIKSNQKQAKCYIFLDEIQENEKGKIDLAYFYKLNNSDVCFNSLSVINNRFDLDHNLENVVYNELLFRGYSVKVYDNDGKEVNFYATKDGKEYYIQVAYTLTDEKTYKREFGAFKNIDYLSQRIIISMDENDYLTSTVRHIPLKDFLKMKEF